MKGVIRFLKRNGFERTGTKSYVNERGCIVIFEDEGYAIVDSKGNAMYNRDFNIYWLVGVLTWYGYIKKDYKS